MARKSCQWSQISRVTQSLKVKVNRWVQSGQSKYLWTMKLESRSTRRPETRWAESKQTERYKDRQARGSQLDARLEGKHGWLNPPPSACAREFHILPFTAVVKLLEGPNELQVEAAELGPAKIQVHRQGGSKAPAGTRISHLKVLLFRSIHLVSKYAFSTYYVLGAHPCIGIHQWITQTL